MQLEIDDKILFWKKESIYSNFHPCRIWYNNINFHHSEGLFIALKAYTFNHDSFEMAHIANLKNPADAKRYGRECIPTFVPLYWEQVRYDVMKFAVLRKFRQNPHLRDKLLATGNKTFVEASPYDKIWGVGITVCPEAADPRNWKGLNLLGQILEEVRAELRKECIGDIQ